MILADFISPGLTAMQWFFCTSPWQNVYRPFLVCRQEQWCFFWSTSFRARLEQSWNSFSLIVQDFIVYILLIRCNTFGNILGWLCHQIVCWVNCIGILYVAKQRPLTGNFRSSITAFISSDMFSSHKNTLVSALQTLSLERGQYKYFEYKLCWWYSLRSFKIQECWW